MTSAITRSAFLGAGVCVGEVAGVAIGCSAGADGVAVRVGSAVTVGVGVGDVAVGVWLGVGVGVA